MKTIALALVVMLVGANALPHEVNVVESKDQRIIDDIVGGIIDALKALDPIEIAEASAEYSLPVDGIFWVRGYVNGLKLGGFSNGDIMVRLSGSVLSIDLFVPEIALSIDQAGSVIKVFSRTYEAELSGSLVINGISLSAEVELGFSGRLINDINLDLSIGNIESELFINIFGRDISNTINNGLNKLPVVIEENKDNFMRALVLIIRRIIDRIF